MVTDDERKWARIMHPDVPPRCGKFKPGELCSFDAQFFGVHGQQAKVRYLPHCRRGKRSWWNAHLSGRTTYFQYLLCSFGARVPKPETLW